MFKVNETISFNATMEDEIKKLNASIKERERTMFGENYIASELVAKGDVVHVSGITVEEVFTSVCNQAKLPAGISPENLVEELMDRENVLSTAIGDGIAIPHPRRPLVSNNDENCIIVAYLRTPVNMQAPDAKRVYAMFILLSASSHLSASPILHQ